MKLKLLLATLFVCGLAVALALAGATRAGEGTTSGATTTARDHHGKKDGDKDKKACENVELQGSNGSGSVSFTVSKADHKAGPLVGKQVTLTIPAGASLKANACRSATGALTLRVLKVDEHAADESH